MDDQFVNKKNWRYRDIYEQHGLLNSYPRAGYRIKFVRIDVIRHSKQQVLYNPMSVSRGLHHSWLKKYLFLLNYSVKLYQETTRKASQIKLKYSLAQATFILFFCLPA